MQYNPINKLQTIANLQDNWNNNGAKKFNKDFINNIKQIITQLDKQPEIFPTANNSIQLEYDNTNGSYLEIELFTNYADIYITNHNHQIQYQIDDVNAKIINDIVKNFYQNMP